MLNSVLTTPQTQHEAQLRQDLRHRPELGGKSYPAAAELAAAPTAPVPSLSASQAPFYSTRVRALSEAASGATLLTAH